MAVLVLFFVAGLALLARVGRDQAPGSALAASLR